MYRPVPTNRDRAGTLTAVVLIHAALAYAFFNLSGTLRQPAGQDDMQLINVDPLPPPPPIVEEVLELEAAPEEEGEASPPNIESEATPVVAPTPRIALPIPPPMPVTATPNEGNEPTQGAAPVPGPGTGAGGVGTGLGAGGSGTGRGGGGAGLGTRPSLISPTLTRQDYPDEVYRRWPRGGAVFVAIRVQLDGRATDCRVDRSSGNRAIDEWTCRLVESRLRFRPATDEAGRPFVSWYGYIQRDVGRFER